MNYLFKKSILVFTLYTLLSSSAIAAQVTIVAPEKALANRQPIEVLIYLDPEQDTISGLSGSFSFPSEMFSINNIRLEDSAVSLWMKQPSISEEKYLDNRTHVTFEGIFPGGYDGVRSPYYQGKRSGILFSVTLIPKNKGVGSLIIDDIVLNRFDPEATPIRTESVIKTITVPDLLPLTVTPSLLMQVKSTTLSAFVTRDALINNNAWYLVVNDPEPKSAVREIHIAESDEYGIERVDKNLWRTVTVPYVLLSQERTKFIHIKVMYADATYAAISLPPVENSKSILTISRILISVILVFLVLYLYGRSIFTFFKKQL